MVEGIVDERCFGIMGGFYGGYVVMVGVIDILDFFVVGVNFFGMVNFEMFFVNIELWMVVILGIEYGDFEM